jgi:hypothetical protein
MSDSESVEIEKLAEELRAAGLVDTHYHVGPELLPRRYDVTALAEAASAWGATIVLKNHTYPTTPLASLARSRYGARFLGGVVLNRFVGGLNPDAVEGAMSGNHADVAGHATADPPVVVWMPTVHAVSHLRVLGQGFDPRWHGVCGLPEGGAKPPVERPVVAFDDSLRPRPELLAVLEAVARNRCRLATGHLCAEEVERLVPLALDMGVPGVIITHPHYPSVELPDEAIRRLTRDPRVFAEFCFAIHTIEKVPLELIADSIVAASPGQVVVASDFGQVHSDPFPRGTARYAHRLLRLLGDRYDRRDFLDMFSHNGTAALGLQAR